jgi:hypothetical protein
LTVDGINSLIAVRKHCYYIISIKNFIINNV